MTLATATALALALTGAPAGAAAPVPDHPGAATGAGTGSDTGSGTASGTAPRAVAGRASGWASAWGTAHQYPVALAAWPHNWSVEGFSDQSLRQVVRVSAGGGQVRIRVSNRYGSAPLALTGATVARAGDGATVQPGSVRTLRFGAARGVRVAAGRDRVSDPVSLPVRPLEKLTVTFHFARPTGPVSFHYMGLTTTYRAGGDRTHDTSGQPFTATSGSLYALAGVEVAGPRADGTVVAFGDSITDGAGSTQDADNRYPDQLAERLAADGSPLGVVNAGLGGNRLLSDSACFGESGLGRFRHDVLDRPGVTTAVVLLGINDISASGTPDIGCGLAPSVTAQQLIAAHATLARQARARGIKAVGATLMPFKGVGFGYYSEAKDAIRKEVNAWIRTSGAYDAVVDLDRVMADPADPDRLSPGYDAGDHLHTNDAGMDAMAEAIRPHVQP
ncbi:SGNH/GDSL hydrolase family protein [Streptomyces sp. NPDC057638]|uniref:SGNH/GDSL hydrolase family protein n=1 Tax=Streptomyces sp. NPDC057638 TaxID=3346190 RepID=UPI0036ACC397